MDYRQIGQALAAHLNQTSGVPSVAALQGMIADLAPDHPELLLPLRDLVARPGFQGLVTKAGSGGGALQRDAMLNEVRPLFSTQVMEALTEVLNGFLNLPPVSNTPHSPATGGQWHKDQQPSQASPRSDASSTPLPKANAGPAAAAPTAAAGSRGAFWLVTLVVAGLVAGAGAALRSPALCGYVGLCTDSMGSDNADQVLSAARRAEQAMRRAGTLAEYRAGLQQLDGELLKLSDAQLSEEQRQQREDLKATAKQAKTVLAGENADQQRVEKAAAALRMAQEQGGAGRSAQLAVARQELAAIPPRSFAAAEASRLRQELTRLEQASAVSGAPPAEGRAERPSSPSSAPEPRPPAAEPAPYREQPLF